MPDAQVAERDEEMERDPAFWAMLFGFGRFIYSHGQATKENWKKNYDDYINSEPWKLKSNKAKERAGYRCQGCNTPDNIQTHHRIYERLGDELDSDLTVLCDECHSKIHDKR